MKLMSSAVEFFRLCPSCRSAVLSVTIASLLIAAPGGAKNFKATALSPVLVPEADARLLPASHLSYAKSSCPENRSSVQEDPTQEVQWEPLVGTRTFWVRHALLGSSSLGRHAFLLVNWAVSPSCVPYGIDVSL